MGTGRCKEGSLPCLPDSGSDLGVLAVGRAIVSNGDGNYHASLIALGFFRVQQLHLQL